MLLKKIKILINLPKTKSTKWTETHQENNRTIRLKYFDAIKEEGALFNVPFRQFTDDIYSDPIFNPKLITNQEVKQEQEQVEKVQEEQGLKEQYLKDKDAFELESVEDYVQDAMENKIINEEINQEVYDNHLKKRG